MDRRGFFKKISRPGKPAAEAKVYSRYWGSDTVGVLGYGCMRWQMTKDADGKEVINQESVNSLVDYALEHGVNYFDSAPVYLQGQSEDATAQALLRHPRSSYFIATKLSNFRDWSYESSIGMYRSSLERYKTDYIDYYLLHSISDEEEFRKRFVDNGVMDFLLAEREKGHIRHLGFSFHGDESGFDSLLALHGKYRWDFVQIQMNYVDWNNSEKGNCPASYMYPKLVEKGIPVVIMEPLLGGQLGRLPDYLSEKLKSVEPSRTTASWAFRWFNNFPGILTVLSGMTYQSDLEDNIISFSEEIPFEKERMEFMEEIAEEFAKYPLVPCTSCQYCMPCPYGIDIPGLFSFYNSFVNEGKVPDSREGKEFSRLRRRYLSKYARSFEEGRSAEFCIRCGKCGKSCPQHIRIPSEISKIDKFIEELKNTL